MPLSKYRYIVVEGPIGVGKTSLTQRLAERTAAQTLLEKPQDNPFLARFYQDSARYALPTQLFFLFQRINEVRDLAQMDLFGNRTISDYLFEKDTLFARLTLSEDEYKLYQNIYQSLAPQAPTPDLVVYLQASTDALVERIQRRGLRYENTIGSDYLARLAQSYGEFFHHYDAAPLLVVNSDNLNFVDEDEDFELLLQRIQNMRGPREFFSLGRD
ncbi:MAG: deoxynucleoside kinase [Gallionellaceae bacterium]|nr:MAG: deoxynucleoside kinase [Gallionellaceae bacterium]